MSDQYEEQNTDSSGQDQTEGGAGEGGGGEENNEADMIFAPEASKPGRNAGMLMVAFVILLAAAFTSPAFGLVGAASGVLLILFHVIVAAHNCS